jgi:hypothetical protein
MGQGCSYSKTTAEDEQEPKARLHMSATSMALLLVSTDTALETAALLTGLKVRLLFDASGRYSKDLRTALSSLKLPRIIGDHVTVLTCDGPRWRVNAVLESILGETSCPKLKQICILGRGGLIADQPSEDQVRNSFPTILGHMVEAGKVRVTIAISLGTIDEEESDCESSKPVSEALEDWRTGLTD